MTDINKLGEQVAALIKGAEKDKAQIAPMLREVWAALEAKTEVNGVKSKGAWAAKFGITLRYCQYLVKDGSRKRSKREPGSSPRELLKELLDVINCTLDIRAIRIKAAMVMGEIDYRPKRKVEVEDVGEFFATDDTVIRDNFDKDGYVIPVKPAPVVTHARKDGVSKRVSVCEGYMPNRRLKGKKFVSHAEATCPECRHFIDGTEPTKPVAKKKAKRYSQKFTGNFVGIPKVHKTHKMQPGGKRTWCGKTPGETLAIDARMSDKPTCRGCQSGENTDILRKTQVTVVVKDSTDAPVLYDTEAYAKAETWSQKRCIIGSPENLQWSADLEYRRNNPVVDPNADDEFAGERD